MKNLLRAQSKYGLMGSSAKTGKHFFRGSRSTFCIKVPFGIGHPHLHIKCSLYVCGRAQGSQIFKWNSIILIFSKVIAFLVISLSPHGPCYPHIIPMSSPSSPHHPHIIPIVPMSSPCHPHSPHKVPMWSPHPPWLWSPLSPPHVVPTLSPSSPHRPNHPHIIPIISTSSPHHLEGLHIISNPPDTHPTHLHPPRGMGGLESVKMQ